MGRDARLHATYISVMGTHAAGTSVWGSHTAWRVHVVSCCPHTCAATLVRKRACHPLVNSPSGYLTLPWQGTEKKVVGHLCAVLAGLHSRHLTVSR